MNNIICTTGPISGVDVIAGNNQPNIHERGSETDLTIYFESEKNAKSISTFQ